MPRAIFSSLQSPFAAPVAIRHPPHQHLAHVFGQQR
jgi:hypothetical protein